MALGNRMKDNYEHRYKIGLTRRSPVIVRVDGRAFHTFTKSFKRPFDTRLMDAMEHAATNLGCVEMQGFKLGYIQSDEASFLLTDYDTIETDAWFGYDLAKIVSISAACMTAHFNDYLSPHPFIAMFDARAFNIPREEVANYFVWRAKDWERNSLQMLCQANFSHRELHGKGRAAMHEMLHEKGLNWTTDLDERQRNGTFIFRDGSRRYDVLPTYDAISQLVNTEPQ